MQNRWIHHVPGRLRVLIPGLKGNPALAAKLNDLLFSLPGITSVRSNTLTGRTLIYYNPQRIHYSSIIVFVEEIRTGTADIPNIIPNKPVYALTPFRESEDLSLVRQVFQVMFSGIVLVALFLKHRIVGKSAFAYSPNLFGLAAITTVVTGYPIFYSGLQHLAKKRRINYDLVITGVTLSLLILRESFTGLLVTWIINFSELLRTLNLLKAHQAIKNAAGLTVDEVWVKVDGCEVSIPVERLVPGNIVVVNSGQSIPADGEIVSGQAAVDESRMTGVPHTVFKENGAKVLAGSAVLHGRLEIKVERTGEDTYLYQVIRDVTNRVQNNDNCTLFNCEKSDRLIKLSLMLAGGVYLLTGNIGRSLAMLLAASPSAAGLAAPTAVGAAIGNAADRGIYIRDSKCLIAAGKVDTIVFDKTGTLTTSRAEVHDVIIINSNYTQEDIIGMAALAEGIAGHPVAEAIRDMAAEMHIGPLAAAQDIVVHPGAGVRATVGGKRILVGNENLIVEHGVKVNRASTKLMRLRHLGLNPVFVAVGDSLCGILAVREIIKPESREAVEQLRGLGVKRFILLSGDTQDAVNVAADRLGIKEAYGGMHPYQKADFVKGLKEKGYSTAMVGDGINDIAAMAESDAGFALGCNCAESAACAGGIVIPSPDPRMVAETIRLGQQTGEISRQNYNFAIGLSIIGLGLGAAGLITPLSAGLFTNLGTLAVIFNSIDLLPSGKRKPRVKSADVRSKGGNSRNRRILPQDDFRYPLADVDWHLMGPGEACTYLSTDRNLGLTGQAREIRIREYGANILNIDKKVSIISLLFEPFKDFMVQLLLGASLVSVFVGEYADALTILVIIGVEAVLGVVQGLKAEKSLSALKKLSAPTAKVLIDGQVTEIEADLLVPGDIVFLEEGDCIPADCRLLEATNLEVEEGSLTGESLPVNKDPELCQIRLTPLADRMNMLFMGTSVTRGRGTAVVVATGLGTEMGRIAQMLQEAEQEETPLQRQLDELGRKLAFGCLLVCGGVMAAGILRGRPLMEMLRTGVSLAVGAIPEGLPAVVTISLAFGVQRMVKGSAIVRTLPSVETLGNASVICTDKTGTLTKNEMTVTEIYSDGCTWEVTGGGYLTKGEFILNDMKVNPIDDKNLFRILTAAALCNNSDLEFTGEETVASGDPTEAALLVAAVKGGLPWPGIRETYCRNREVSFDPVRKMMTVICHDPDGNASVYTKGAPDHVLDRCSRIYKDNKIINLDVKIRNDILKANERMASKALRVLAVAYKLLEDTGATDEEVENNLVFVGLLGMEDPPRPGVFEAVQKCRRAGIKVVMVTGDHQATACAIARQLSIYRGGMVLTGTELEQMSDEQLVSVIDRVEVCSRTTPEQKLRIVKAFKRQGNIVAMTGDGVNDAPAVKEADIGIAMGKKGTDVTREAAAITLADDNFATIVTAVEEGRTVGDNIRKSIRYVLAGNFGEVLAIFTAAVMGMPMPLIPSQILWVNLVTESVPAMALGADPPAGDVMDRNPGRPDENIISGGLSNKIITHGVLTGVTTFGVFAATLALGGGLVKARTMAFSNLVISQLFNLFDCRRPFDRVGENNTGNKLLVPSAVASGALLLTVIYVPVLRPLFQTVPLGLRDWGTLIISSGLAGRVDNIFGNSKQVTAQEDLNTPLLLPEKFETEPVTAQLI